MRLKFQFLIILMSCVSVVAHSQINFPTGSNFQYAKGLTASSVASDWYASTASTASWSSGDAPFWFGDGGDGVGTHLSDIQNSYLTFYLTSTFTAENIDRLKDLKFSINYDDGFAVYINGVEVLSQNAPTNRSYTSPAPENHESGAFEQFTVSSESCNLKEGKNHIAVQVFNVSYTSSDVYFDLGISADVQQPALPDSVKVKLNYDAGFYDAPFTLQMHSSDAVSQILYTLDASDPRYSSSAVLVAAVADILIDPASAVGRPITPGVVVRACAFQDGYEGGKVKTRTYIFPNKVKTQVSPGGLWPTASVNGQLLDFSVSSDIANDSRYTNEIEEALLDISTLSLVTDAENLFSPSTGIYVNALEDGMAWERPCSFEMLDKDTTKGFQEDAGLRIRGGYSRNDQYYKHSFRLFFRNEYGAKKLKYPLFEDEGVSEFDKIDLRTAQNYAWYRGDKSNTMVREVFSRDLQGDMGQPYTRSRYYHLYVNGLYYGLYQTQERSEASYAESYMGGDKDDYDVVKASRVNGDLQNVLLDGSDESWRDIYAMTSLDFSDDENYFKFLGCNAEGERDLTMPVLVDIDNLIDYMIVIFYTGNFDSPLSAFGGNKKPNNYYGIDNRNNPLDGFKFFAHDSEHSLFSEAHSPGIGLYENRVNIHLRSDDKQMLVDEFIRFQPQWLHAKLSDNEEYCIRFANRAYQHFSEGGVLSQNACRERLLFRKNQIDKAIIGESLKWGKTQSYQALNREDHWVPEIDKIINDFFPYRADIVKNQLLDVDLYPAYEGPIVSVDNVLQKGSRYDFDSPVELTVGMPITGILIYTLDGQDPRAIGGGVSSSALTSDEELVFSVDKTTQIQVRFHNDGKWSACREFYLSPKGINLKHLKITELNYHPLDSINGTDTIGDSKYEFIELKNTSSSEAINIGGMKFDNGVDYTFPDNCILAPQQFYVIASDAYGFYTRYGQLPSGEYLKQLSNDGEKLSLLQPNDSALIAFSYQDEAPWVADADGLGYSMISYETNPVSYTPDLTVYWWASSEFGGSPFADDAASKYNGTHLEPVSVDKSLALSLFPNPANSGVYVSINGLSDDEILDVEICTITGQTLLSRQIVNRAYLPLDSYLDAEGVFIVRVHAKGHVYMNKLIYHP